MSLKRIGIPNLTEVEEGVWTGGQPSAAQLRAAREAGLESVVNLCPPPEADWDEKAAAEALGLAYTSIAVAGACDVTDEAAGVLHEALEASPKPVLVHCGSGNRVGALFALRAHRFEGLPAHAALDRGRAAGLGEPRGHGPADARRLLTPRQI